MEEDDVVQAQQQLHNQQWYATMMDPGASAAAEVANEQFEFGILKAEDDEEKENE